MFLTQKLMKELVEAGEIRQKVQNYPSKNSYTKAKVFKQFILNNIHNILVSILEIETENLRTRCKMKM